MLFAAYKRKSDCSKMIIVKSEFGKECNYMRKFRTVVSVIIMILCAVAGFFLRAFLNNAIGGCILGILISGIACTIYVLDNQDKD